MSVLEKLASAQGRRDDVLNQELARELANSNATDAIHELVVNLNHRDRRIQSDCIKVLYEIGYIKPELIAEYVSEFLALLRSKNNRLVWGGMIALSTIAPLKADVLFEHREEIIRAIESGSVITQDRGIKTLAIIGAQNEAYLEILFPYLIDHLRNCPAKDIPLRAEAVLQAINAKNKDQFINVVKKRIPTLAQSQVKRLQKIIKEAEKR